MAGPAQGVFEASPGSTITEGIGILRKTANFARAKLDGSFQGSNQVYPASSPSCPRARLSA